MLKYRTLLASLLLFAAAAFFAEEVRRRGGVERAGADGDVMALVFGEARKVVGNAMLDRADLYFHGGIEEQEGDTHDCALETAKANRGGRAESGSDHKHGPECNHGNEEAGHEKAPEKIFAKWDWWSRLNKNIHSAPAQHLAKENSGELIPWFWAAIKTDPHNTRAYALAAYWLHRPMHRMDEGMRLIAEGIRKNPDSCELEFCRGSLLVAQYRSEPAKAIPSFEAAIRKFDVKQFEAVDDAEFFQRRTMLWLSSLNRQAGNIPAARKWLTDGVLRLYPTDEKAHEMLLELDRK